MLRLRPILPALMILLILSGCTSPTGLPQTHSPIRKHSGEAVQKLRQEELQIQPWQHTELLTDPVRPATPAAQPHDFQLGFPDSQFLIATGHGVLRKGHLTCQRVSEASARAQLAKQIRVLVKEHAIDRVRERTGEPTEQEIEIVREEIANELLTDVKIVDRNVNEAEGTCSSTAVMPKSHITPKSITNLEISPVTP